MLDSKKEDKNESGSKQSRHLRAETLSISGFNNMKFDLILKSVNLSQRSRQKSVENMVADLVSQKSKTAS